MMRSLFSGVTGLKSHQTKMDVIGNNISNVNTLGYKRSVTNFADLYSETVASASGPSQNVGGINARQIGQGVSVNSIVVKHNPGAAQYTGNTLDLAIEGDGYFVLRTNDGERYSRAGNLSLTSNGTLVNPSGYFVQCYGASYITGNEGKADTIGFGQSDSYFRLTSNTAATPPYTPPANISELATGDYNIQFVEDKDAAGLGLGTYKVKVYRNDVDVTTKMGTITVSEPFFTTNTAGTLTKDADITVSIGNLGDFKFQVVDNVANADRATAMLSINSMLSNAIVNVTNNDRFEATGGLGDMVIDPEKFKNVAINEEGAIIAQLKADMEWGNTIIGKDEKVVLGYVGLATFTNNEGLEKVATNLYRTSQNSGRASYALPGTDGKGKLTPSSLEMSNVDLADETVNMITTQRGFQANSRIITVSDSMLEELVNLKR